MLCVQQRPAGQRGQAVLWVQAGRVLQQRLPDRTLEEWGAQIRVQGDEGDDDEGPRCWVCFEGKSAGPLVAQGCACRVDDNGSAHFDCLLTNAKTILKRDMKEFASTTSRRPGAQFEFCPTCHQPFGATLSLRLAKEAPKFARALAAGGDTNMSAAHNISMWARNLLIDAHVRADEHAEALALMEKRIADTLKLCELLKMTSTAGTSMTRT
jgi:hypothetical protein